MSSDMAAQIIAKAWMDASFADALQGQPFQHGHLCARSLAVETCLPFSYGIRFGGFFLGPRGCF